MNFHSECSSDDSNKQILVFTMNTLVIILNWNIRFLRIFINRVLIHNLAIKYIRLRLGQEIGSAFTSVLFGDYNPSGKYLSQ